MKAKVCTMPVVLALGMMVVGFRTRASAREMVVPAGTIVQCTLNEPNLSKATVNVGDPVVCHLRGLAEFGEQAFPRGSYLVGHLESAKDPGHFFGKGYLKLQFDRIGLPSGDMPLDARIIATRGYKVDKQGDIKGKGHAKRDVAEWMLPPMWPWKVLMLPARGPKPKLKGETTLSLRLMDDVQITTGPQASRRQPVQFDPQGYQGPTQGSLMMPQVPATNVQAPRCGQTYGPEWHYFGQPRCESQSGVPGTAIGPVVQNVPSNGPTAAEATKASYATYKTTPVATATRETAPVFVMKDGTALSPSHYSYVNGRITYTLDSGERGVIGSDQVDWAATTQANQRRGVRLSLHSERNLN
jgi:hypothetical protein